MDFDCCICGKPLEEPGALAFSPPEWPFGMVDKFHICKLCWFAKIRKVLRGTSTEESPVAEGSSG